MKASKKRKSYTRSNAPKPRSFLQALNSKVQHTINFRIHFLPSSTLDWSRSRKVERALLKYNCAVIDLQGALRENYKELKELHLKEIEENKATSVPSTLNENTS